MILYMDIFVNWKTKVAHLQHESRERKQGLQCEMISQMKWPCPHISVNIDVVLSSDIREG